MPFAFTLIGGHEFILNVPPSSVRALPRPRPTASRAHVPAREVPQTSRPVEAMTAGREHKQAASDRGVGLAATYVSPTGRGSRRGR